MRKENKHDVRWQRLDHINKSTFMVLIANEDGLEPHVFSVVSWNQDGVNSDEISHTNMAANCIFPLRGRAKPTLFRKEPSFTALLCVCCGADGNALIKTGPNK